MESFWFNFLLVIIVSNVCSGNGEIVQYNDTVKNFQNLLFQFSKPLILSSIKDINVSQRCRADSEFYLKSLQNLELWAIQMYDATGKMPSGLTNGNTHISGDLDMCRYNVEKLSEGQMKGQYCLAQIYVEPIVKNKEIEQIMRRVHSYKAFHTKYEDELNGDLYFLPNFNKATWAFCIPSTCTYYELENFLQHILKPYNHSTGLEFKLRVRPSHCKTNEEITVPLLDFKNILLVGIYVLYLVTILATLYDYYYSNYELCDEKYTTKLSMQIFYAFSVRRNWKLLIAEDKFRDDIPCIHGLRTIFTILIYYLHRIIAEFFKPLTNRTEAVESTIGPSSMFIRVFLNYVGTFAILSGLLTSYFAVAKLQQGHKLNIPLMYITRYLKFLPGLLAIFVLIDSNYDFFTNPAYFNVVVHYEKMCKDHFWQRLFLVENWYGLNDMCYPVAHQLYTDFQLYLTAPFIILLLWTYSAHAKKIFVALIVIFSTITAITTYWGNFSMLFYFGRSLQDARKSFDFMYTNPIYWMVFYLCGIWLGYYLRTSKEIYLREDKLILGWIFAILGFYYSFFAMSEASTINYKYNRFNETLYTTLQPIIWSYTICWIILNCQAGYGGFINKFLSWRKFTIATKLSYAFYICSMGILMQWYAGNVSVPQYFQPINFFGLNEIIVIICASIWITICFMIPTIHIIQILRNLFFEIKDHTKMSVADAKKSCKQSASKQKSL